MHEIQFQLQPADIEAWYLSGLDQTNRITYWSCGLVTAGLLAVGADKMAASVPVSAAAAVCGFAGGWALARAAARSHLKVIARKMTNKPGAPDQFGAYKLSVDAAGVSETGPAEHHTHAWSALLELTETADHLFLTTVGGSAYIVPKRAFESGAALNAFRTTVAGNLKSPDRSTG